MRIAFGAQSRLCCVDPRFKCIVIVEQHDAYNSLPPPLLNRFEKHVLRRCDVVDQADPETAKVLRQLAEFAARFASAGETDKISEVRGSRLLGFLS